MLEPREADIPAVFLVFIVLPLVAYILLGKWSEAAKKRERISLLAQLAAEEALRAETMAAASVMPLLSSSTNGIHVCARCFAPATTRCSRCKSVRYCSGKCQITHWRQVHRQECLTTSSSSYAKDSFTEEFFLDRGLHNDTFDSRIFRYNDKWAVMENTSLDNMIHPSMLTGASATTDFSGVSTSEVNMLERRTTDKWVCRKSNRDMLRKEDLAVLDSEESSRSWDTNLASLNNISSKEGFVRHKPRSSDSAVPEERTPKRLSVDSSNGYYYGSATARSAIHENYTYESQHGNMAEARSNNSFSSLLCSAQNGTTAEEVERDFGPNGGNLLKGENNYIDETMDLNSSGGTSVHGSGKSKKASHLLATKNSKSPKSMLKVPEEQSYSGTEKKAQILDDSNSARIGDNTVAQESNGVTSMGIMKMIGLRKSTKLGRHDYSGLCGDKSKKIKMLFPYEEFMKFFRCEVFGFSPRGLLNCGNSCYANAVLQCLTFTKPLIVYLLHGSHSRACCGKDWCLMCELEQHVMMLRESGGPMSPSRILSHMRSINCQIGDGSQEDAHEFLRLLVASMQSICLEGVGGESRADPRLQETTFVQYTFGGRLRSKVNCLRCYHESERYENIMDLTLEIFGWVESLENALTQFTTPEDLDGENMYRCSRCATYVRARKQLSIHEAPNILTIVLKRFQEGKYGKLNKCITFPDMLDMIPFMTGTGDMPPLYMLYAVVVHLDTLNASFSGHYVAYVKDLQGNWFRIDDTEVHPVAVNQVMSEGAYILFYMRSCPRPQRTCTGKSMHKQAPTSSSHCTLKTQEPSRAGQCQPSSYYAGPDSLSDLRPDIPTCHSSNDGFGRSTNRNIRQVIETYTEPVRMEFSDATSSDWSIFTSSDEASFTTESTRDSFSTVDYGDSCNIDPFSSIFNNLYPPESSSHNTVSCRRFSNSRSRTRFVPEEKGYVLGSYLLSRQKTKEVSDLSGNTDMFVKYGSNPSNGLDRTSRNCKL